MKYEEFEKEIKKLAEMVRGFPAEIREKSFDVLLKALLKEKERGQEPSASRTGTEQHVDSYLLTEKISKATGIREEVLLGIFDPTAEGIVINIDPLNITSVAEETRAYAKLIYLYKKKEDRNFKGMPLEALRKLITENGGTNNTNARRDLKAEKEIFTIASKGELVGIKPLGEKKITEWLSKELSEDA